MQPQRVVAEERVSSSDDIEARRSIDGSLQEDLFGDNQDQDLQQVRDVMNAQEEALALARPVRAGIPQFGGTTVSRKLLQNHSYRVKHFQVKTV